MKKRREKGGGEEQNRKREGDKGGQREKEEVPFNDGRESSATFFAHNVITRYCIAFGKRLSFYLTHVSLLNQPSAILTPSSVSSFSCSRSNASSSFINVAKTVQRKRGREKRKCRQLPALTVRTGFLTNKVVRRDASCEYSVGANCGFTSSLSRFALVSPFPSVRMSAASLISSDSAFYILNVT